MYNIIHIIERSACETSHHNNIADKPLGVTSS